MSRANLTFWMLFSIVVAPLALAAEPQLVPTPRAQRLPISITNRPFLAAAQAQQPVDLAARGYLEAELLVSGYANVYDWAEAGSAADRKSVV